MMEYTVEEVRARANGHIAVGMGMGYR